MPAKKSTRATRTKQETAAAFEEIQDKIASTPTVPTAEVELRKTQEREVRSFAEGFSVEKSVQTITAAGLNITKTLSSIAEQVQQSAKELDDLKKAKELYTGQIEALYGVEVTKASAQDLEAEYSVKKEMLAAEHAAELKQHVQEMETVREEWERQQEEYNRQQAELKLVNDQARLKEANEYNYQRGLERQRAEIDWQNKMVDLKRANELKQAELERDWTARTEALKAKEAEFTAYKSRVDAIPAEVDAAVKKAEAIASNSIKREYQHQVEMMQRTHESQQTVNLNTIASLQAQIKQLAETNLALTAKVAASEEKVANIANEALKAASGRQALNEVQSFMQNQNTPSGNNKRT